MYQNVHEDRFLENLDRRLGARTSGSSTFVPNYSNATARNVWRRSDAAVEAPKATPAPRPVAPVVKKVAPVVKAPEPVVAKAVEAEAPTSQFTELAPLADRVTLQDRFMAVRDALMEECEHEDVLSFSLRVPSGMLDDINEASSRYLERLTRTVEAYECQLEDMREARTERMRKVNLEGLRTQFDKKPAAPPVVKPPEDFTWTFDLSRPKRVKPPKKGAKAKAKSESFMPTSTAPKHEPDCTGLPGRIALLSENVIATVYANKANGLTWRYATKVKLESAARLMSKSAGIKHVAAFVEACEKVVWERFVASQVERGQYR